MLSTTIDRPLVRVRPHLVFAAFDSLPAMALDPEPQWRWQMCKRAVVEVKAKARKKASVNDKGHLDICIPQRSNSTLNGPEATAKPTYRCRQRHSQVTHTCRGSLDARQTCYREDRLFDLGKQPRQAFCQKIGNRLKVQVPLGAVPTDHADTGGLSPWVASMASNAAATGRMQWAGGQLRNRPLTTSDISFHTRTCVHRNLQGHHKLRRRESGRRKVLCRVRASATAYKQGLYVSISR
jgi:hypothetical protein